MDSLSIYTDGSVFRNPDGCGWSAVLTRGPLIIGYASGGIRGCISATRAELMAITVGARVLLSDRALALGVDWSATILCDSQALVILANAVVVGERAAPHQNSDLWEKVVGMINGGHITLGYVKGHDGNFYNSLADVLAREAAYRTAVLSKRSRVTLVRRLPGELGVGGGENPC